VFGVPFEIVPFKANPQAGPVKRPIKRHVHPLPDRAALEIKFPRVDGYAQQVRNRIAADWTAILPTALDPQRFSPEVQVKAFLPSTAGRMTLEGPGQLEDLSIEAFRKTVRVQEIAFALTRDLTTRLAAGQGSTVPLHALFPQVLAIVQRVLVERVDAPPGTDVRDCILSPYYGILLDKLAQAIHPDASAGEAPEIPLFEKSRGPGSTSEVDFWTAREVYPIKRSHLNYVVADTKTWEQSAAFQLDTHKRVRSFAKNAGLGFAIPYLFEGVARDYLPDFIVRLEEEAERYLILEVKGFDRAETEKREGAARWVMAVNADGRYGQWRYDVAKALNEVRKVLDAS
jgi:type III restriction enzyme